MILPFSIKVMIGLNILNIDLLNLVSIHRFKYL